MLEPPSRRELRRAVRGGRGSPIAGPGLAGPGRPTGRPTVFYYAVALLALASVFGLVGGVVAVRRNVALGIGLLAFAVVAAVAVWRLVRRTVDGYWLAIAVLTVAGVGPIALFLAAGNASGVVLFCPPLIVAVIMLRPSARAAIVRDH
jgi:4-amino-4-deoxy-L-arabinose transferase-like glycosyltransferase